MFWVSLVFTIVNFTLMTRFVVALKMLREKGLIDIVSALKEIKLPLYLAWADIRQRYRRSTLGPFWITISTGVMIACLGIIFGTLFKVPSSEFLPYLSVGLILWAFVSTTITEATSVFSTYEAIIKQLPIPLFMHVIRMVARNFYIFLHNIVLIPFVLLCVQRPVNWEIFLFIPGIFLVVLNLLWVSLVLGTICARYRDLSQIVSSCLQIFFYVTPIIWMPSALPARASLMVLAPNPFYHFMEIVRAPLMGFAPTTFNWAFCIICTITGSLFALIFFNKFRNRIAYWL